MSADGQMDEVMSSLIAQSDHMHGVLEAISSSATDMSAIIGRMLMGIECGPLC